MAPPTLPSLTERDSTFELQFTGAGVGVPPDERVRARSNRNYAWFLHGALEYPIEPRQWFFGTAFDVASVEIPDLGHQLTYTNPELWVRGVWSNRHGLAAGGSLGLVVPLPHELGAAGRDVLESISVVRPGDTALFTDNSLTARPALDVRLIGYPFVLQLRQGLDLSYSFSDGRSDILARAGAYVGFDLLDPLGIGVELFEVYAITAEVPDDRRSAFTFSPSLRLRLPAVEPTLSVLVPFGTPLGAAASSFFAVRLGATFVIDPARTQRAPAPETDRR